MRTRIVGLGIALLAVFSFSTKVFAADMFSGTWTLNIAKTHEPVGARKAFTKAIVEKIDADDNGIKVVADTAGGAHVEYAVKFDGKDYPYTATIDGKPNPGTIGFTRSATKIDDYTIVFNIKTPRGSAKEIMSISKDGKTRTVTQPGTGATDSAVIIWDKQ